MLDLFRARGLANVVYGVIIIATITVFVIQFRPNAGQKSASLKETCVATVRGWCLDPKDHRAALLLMIRSPQGGEMTPAAVKQLKVKDAALSGLIERELLVGEAERLGIMVTEQEVTDQLFDGFVRASVPSDDASLAGKLPIGREGLKQLNFKDPKTKAFDLKIYERRIKNETGMSPQQFREEQTREILAAKVRDLVRAPIRVSEAEAYDEYLRTNNTATVAYADVKESWVAEYAVSVTDADVAAWQKDHQADLDKEWESRKEADLPKDKRVRHILAEFKGRAAATPEEKQAALAKISAAWARLKKGEPFAYVAREVTDDPGSKRRGGGYDSMEGFDPFFKKTGEALKPGETTQGAIETAFGYHILLKDDPNQAAALEPQLKKALARELCTKAKAAEAQKEVAQKIIDAVKDGKSLDDAVKGVVAGYTKPMPVLEPAKIIKDDTKPAADADAGAATGDAGSKPSGAAAPKKDDPKKDEKPAPLKMVDAAQAPDAPKAETSSAFNAGGDPFPGLTPPSTAQILKFAFHSKDGGVMDQPVTGPGGTYVVQLKEHHTATKEDFDKERDIQLARLLTSKQNEALALYVQRLKEQFKGEIKRDENFFKEPDGGAPAQTPADEDEY